MYDIKKIISKLQVDQNEAANTTLADMIESLIHESSDPSKYENDLYILCNGYHFNEGMYKKASEYMDMKWTPDMVSSVMNSYGISFKDEYKDVTIYDVAYVMNMLYKMYYPLISDSSSAAKYAEKFIKCKYPIAGGRAFAEWMLKCKLSK